MAEPTRTYEYAVAAPPNRGVMIAIDVHVDTAIADNFPRSVSFFFNPPQVGLVASAVWAKLDVPGLSHQVLQYSHTESTPIDFDLRWTAHEVLRRKKETNDAVDDPDDFRGGDERFRSYNQFSGFKYRDFLYSFSVPMSPGRAPSRCMIIWPNFLSVICVVDTVDFSFTRFAKSGWPMDFVAKMKMTEHRAVFRQRDGRQNFFTRVDQKLVGQEQELQQTAERIQTDTDTLLDF